MVNLQNYFFRDLKINWVGFSVLRSKSERWGRLYSSAVVVPSPSRVQLFGTPWTAAHQAALSLAISRSLPKFMFTALVMLSSHLILWCPPLLLPSIFPSIRDFSNDSCVHIRWPQYWSFSFSIIPSSAYSGLSSFKSNWFDLAIQQTLRSLLQHHSSKASILRHSAFFIVQLSHPYMTTGKIITLTRWTFVGKVMSLLFNMLSRLVITFLPRSKHLSTSWLQSPSGDPKQQQRGWYILLYRIWESLYLTHTNMLQIKTPLRGKKSICSSYHRKGVNNLIV